MKTETLNVADEVDAIGKAAQAEWSDVKAKKGMGAYIGDAMPVLISLASNYAQLPSDVKRPDDIAYLAKCVAGIFLPAA